MFLGRERNRSIFHPRPINHPDVLMRIRDTMNVQKARRYQRASAVAGRRWALAEDFDFEPTFLFGLAKSSFLRIFMQFNVPAERQPFVQIAMVDEKDFGLLNDEDRYREINFFVNVSHRSVLVIVQAAIMAVTAHAA